MAKAVLPKDADALAATGYDTVPPAATSPTPPAGATPATAEPVKRDGYAEWLEAREKSLLEGDPADPVFGIAFDSVNAPPSARVRAPDSANAWERYRKQMGINHTEHEPRITVVSTGA